MKIFLNNEPFETKEAKTVLEAAREAGVFIPTLCAYPGLSHTPGTCGICLAEISYPDGPSGIRTSCRAPLAEGMRINTKGKEVRAAQRAQLELLFADHDFTCQTCSRYGDCELLDLSAKVGLNTSKYTRKYYPGRPADTSDISIHLDAGKCIRCERCVEVCTRVQGLSSLMLHGKGGKAAIGLTEGGLWIDSNRCVRCGQCTVVCPTGALTENDQTEQVIEWLDDPEITTVFQFAPAVRATLGEAMGLPAGTNVEKKIVSALKKVGADFVLDTNFTADVTIMEEGTELLERLADKNATVPLFTSCCPAWVNYVEQHKPELIPHISTTRSPQGIMGSLAKTYLPEKKGINKEQLRTISIMPCTAKKDEASRKALSKEGVQDTDLVITAREFSKLLKRYGVDLKNIEDQDFDSPFMSESTGAGVIFGRTGGVAEAAVRTVYKILTGTEADKLDFKPSKHPGVHLELDLDLGDKGKVKVGVVYGLANAAKIADEVLAGKSPYNFIEVMACPGGCINGGGTPREKGNFHYNTELRAHVLDASDRKNKIRQSHNNPEVQVLYRDYLEKPNSHKAHELLHTHYTNRKPVKKPAPIKDVWQKVTLV